MMMNEQKPILRNIPCAFAQQDYVCVGGGGERGEWGGGLM